MIIFVRLFFLAVMTLSLIGCEEPPPPGFIKVKNDSQDSEYNILDVSGGGKSYSLKPGEFGLIPKGTTIIYFARAYKDHTKRYTVNCPHKIDDGVVVKLIDVYLNRMQGGCKLVSNR